MQKYFRVFLVCCVCVALPVSLLLSLFLFLSRCLFCGPFRILFYCAFSPLRLNDRFVQPRGKLVGKLRFFLLLFFRFSCCFRHHMQHKQLINSYLSCAYGAYALFLELRLTKSAVVGNEISLRKNRGGLLMA